MADRAADIITEWERRESDRTVHMSHWQDIANFSHPNRNDYIVTRTPGMKRMTYVFDATAIWANDQLSAGLHALLTSPYLPWFYLEPDNERLLRDDDVRLWLEAATARLYAIFSSPRYNFAAQSHELYQDLASIGQACMAILESERSGILFSARHMKENCIAENEEDRIDSNIRRWTWTAKQAWQQWGKASPPAVQQAMSDNAAGKSFRFLHLVGPRRNYDPQRADKKNMPFESCYVSVDDKTLIAESGFQEFPYLLPRLEKCSGETYGRGRGTMALPDVKMLNEMKKTVIKAAQKVVDPPLQVPDQGFLMNIKTVPGSINYYRADSQGRIEPIETKGQVQLGIELLNALQAQIMRTYYVDWLIMPSDLKDPAASGKGVTATYVLQQRDEKMRMISPMLARLNGEFTDPAIDRVFAMEWRKSKALKFGPGSPFPPPPAQLSGVPLRVRYVSPIALAQKAATMDGTMRLIQLSAQIQQIQPNGPVYLDGEYILREAARDWYAPVGALKSPERLQEEAKAAAEQQQRAEQAQGMEAMAGAAKDGTKALVHLRQAQPANDLKEAA